MENEKTIKEDLLKLDSEIDRLILERGRLQEKLAAEGGKVVKYKTLEDKIKAAIAAEPVAFPKKASVACQGVAGANSQIAAEKLFGSPYEMFFKTFEGVFSAIDKGLCEYGVLPIENSTAGQVNAVYDLMMKYRFYIVRSVRVKVDHNLMVKPGTKKEEIREIFSHEQALMQCAEYLKGFPGVKITAVENTAVAARMVQESEEPGVACLCTRACEQLYHLECLEKSVQDHGGNYTRFICIARHLQIYPGANRTSVMAVLPHKPGALYHILKQFADLGCNLSRIQSRPIPDRDFEFMFYLDFETSVYSEEFTKMLTNLAASCEEFEYLGSYEEQV